MSQKPSLFTSLSPALLHLYDVHNTVVVVIDVFRATSTIASALHNGANCIIPVDAVSKAVAISKELGGIAAGERDGKLAEGLQYGNSPLEYSREFIQDKILVLTTTNGTKLLHMALANGAEDIVTGSFPNLSAICQYLITQNKNVVLACAGWKDRFNIEDTLFAGAIIHRVKDHFCIHCDSSFMAENIYLPNKTNLLKYAEDLTHYHRLVNRFGYIDDIEFCLTEDVANVLPLFKDGKLVVAN
ncbi:MAG TPA: 2-phosphosulfolactate phosphatase [Niabella sp.]|nr:2-phosphosulfolactate phosphatase [Niabella sp.]HOZ98249.1 2-phosphosulfolactate phosphatase [Niabella sp.]HQW13191.1 2-phosphosulfolactate phosphatase [Niabella sp.]HQX18769.1 2-phosphosulfolactate phosphatase [Niabella sp.]HQX41159.1 2-phosphosulfolactate phosphatase [Niabella sp.]